MPANGLTPCSDWRDSRWTLDARVSEDPQTRVEMIGQGDTDTQCYGEHLVFEWREWMEDADLSSSNVEWDVILKPFRDRESFPLLSSLSSRQSRKFFYKGLASWPLFMQPSWYYYHYYFKCGIRKHGWKALEAGSALGTEWVRGSQFPHPIPTSRQK